MFSFLNNDYLMAYRYFFEGVLWKSATDPLQASIWEKQHMDKIVPSILFNLQDDGIFAVFRVI